MKRIFLLLAVYWFGLLAAAHAQGADDQYIRIYNVMQQADALQESGQTKAALEKYLDARSSLEKFKRVYPDWNPRIVTFRLNYLAARIAPLVEKEPTAPSLEVELATPSRGDETSSQPAADVTAKVEDLETHVRQLEADKLVLESKLKEALSVQPAAVDPRELDKAREQIGELEKENELLKTSLEQEKKNVEQEKAKAANLVDASEVEKFREQIAEANRKLAEQLEMIRALEEEKKVLQSRLDTRPEVDPEEVASLKRENEELTRKLAESEQRKSYELEMTQKNLARANDQIAEQMQAIASLEKEKQDLQAGSTPPTQAPDLAALSTLRQENARLKQQLEDANTRAKNAAVSVPANQGEAATLIASLKEDIEMLNLEKAALQSRIRSMSVRPVTSTSLPPEPSAESAARIKRLEEEKQTLEKRLETATKQLYGSDARASGRMQQMTDQMANIRARLEVLEAKRVPYSEEELALMKQPVAVVDPNEGRTPLSELPAGTKTLLKQAQQAFAAGKYAEAEQSYQEILKRDEKNVYSLANLSAIQMEEKKFSEAESNLKRALEIEPENDFTLSLFGLLRFQQGNYDEALDYLGRAAKINPQSADTQNYLGLVLSHEGFRGPAETALRRAIQLNPNHAAAHNNLAAIYITQNPPMVELARWHYQKALAAGHPPNADLERMIERASNPTPQQ